MIFARMKRFFRARSLPSLPAAGFLLFILSTPLAAGVVTLGKKECSAPLDAIQVLRGPLTLDEARRSAGWMPIDGPDPDFGFSRDVFWFQVQFLAPERF